MKCLADHVRHLLGPAHVVHLLCGWRGNSGDVRFLKGIGVTGKRWHLARYNHQRHVVTVSVRNGRNGIGCGRSRRHHTYPNFARSPRIPHRSPRCARFSLEDGHFQVFCLLQGIHPFHNGTARQSHNLLHTLSPQQSDEQISAAVFNPWYIRLALYAHNNCMSPHT